MSNIYVEAKGPKGVNAKESLLPDAVSGFTRGLAVTYGSDQYHAALIDAAGARAIGLIEEDAISLQNPISVIEFGQAVAQIGADVDELLPLTTNAAGQLVPALPGQPVVAVSLEPQNYVAPGSFANVFVLGSFGFLLATSAAVTYFTASGAIPVATGTYVLNGAAALAMTLAAPTDGQDGTRITIVGLTAYAHTVTTAANKIVGEGSAGDKLTFANVGDTAELLAINGNWIVPLSMVSGNPAISEV